MVLPKNVRVTARESHSNSSFRGLLKSKISFASLLAVLGNGFPPGPKVCSVELSPVLALRAVTMLRAVNVTRKKPKSTIG